MKLANSELENGASYSRTNLRYSRLDFIGEGGTCVCAAYALDVYDPTLSERRTAVGR